jgi:AcrR family transcriptional regulator
LLTAARELFARHGYEGTSVRAITRLAGANLGAVNYHFGSKRGLFEAVVASIIAPLRERFLRAGAEPGAPLDRIERIMRAAFHHIASAPDTPRFVIRVLATGGRPPAAVSSWIREAVGVLSRIVEEGQREGSIRPGDPPLMAISVMSQPFHLTIVRVPLREALALDQDDVPTRTRVVVHAALFVRRALATPGAAAPAAAAPPVGPRTRPAAAGVRGRERT